MSFFAELKRRNVFRVGVAYAVIGWVLAQVAGFAAETFGAPDWVMKMLVVVLLLGLPLALFFAWAFELTPEGIKREKDVDRSASITRGTGRKLDFVIVGVLAIAVGILVVDRFVHNEGIDAPVAGTELTQAGGQEVIATDSPSIAVLPFVNMSGDDDYFADGLSEELLNLLSKVPDLKVAGRTSSFVFKDKTEDLRAIGDALGVNHVLEGSVRRSGDRLRITAQLIKVKDGFHLWSETYDRRMADIFDIQDDVASSITAALKVRLTNSGERLTDNAEAYALYLQALPYVTANSDPDVLEKVTPMLDAAIRLDPAFARAHELKALIYWGRTGEGIAGAVARPMVFGSATAALAIDPTLSVARLLAMSADDDIVGWAPLVFASEAAMTASPDDYDVVRIVCDHYLIAGYLEKALRCGETLIRLEPLSSLGYYRKGIAESALGRVDDASASFARTVELGGSSYLWDLAMVDLFRGDYDAAIRRLEDSPYYGWSADDARWIVDNVLKPGGDPSLLDNWIAEKRAGAGGWLNELGLYHWYLLTGNMDAYWRIIDERFEADPSNWNDTDWLIRPGIQFPESGFIRHPKYLDYARKHGLLDLWEARGAPDRCSKDSGKWVCE